MCVCKFYAHHVTLNFFTVEIIGIGNKDRGSEMETFICSFRKLLTDTDGRNSILRISARQ